jgi:SAM-dependent methyltransferase
MKCRNCELDIDTVLIDLGSSPPSNSYLTKQTFNAPEKWYPLKVMVCNHCWLVQTEDFVGADEMFSEDYAYFSSYSTSWIEHAKKYVYDMVERFNLDDSSRVVEIAANDGYLLQFIKQNSIPCYGIEPTHSTAIAAREKGIDIIEEFFGVNLANNLVVRGKQADLIAANNVLAHVPDINDFVKGFSVLLKPEGVATFEFPHLLNLIEQNQFDTIYHEHYSYLSLNAVSGIFSNNGLSVFDVEELSSHGGSLRVYVQRNDMAHHLLSDNVEKMLQREKSIGLINLEYYRGFQERAEEIKIELLEFLITAKKQHKKVIAYGAAAKGNTLLNFSGIKSDLISYVVDKSPAKQNKYMPGSRIPIVNEEQIKSDKPEYVLILPWNLGKEIMEQLHYIREWDGQFVTSIPKLEIQ